MSRRITTILSLATVAIVLTGQPAIASLPAERAWHAYVLGPARPNVPPVAVEARGAVTNAHALVRDNGRGTTLTTTAGHTPASVLLDFGKDVAGAPYFDITALTGAPTLTFVTSEARQFIRTPAATTTTAATGAGATQVPLAAATNLEAGNRITFGAGDTAQTGTVTAIAATPPAVTLARPLRASIPTGAAVTTSPGAPTADDNGGLSGFGGTATLQPSTPGRIIGPFRGGFRFLLLTLTTPGTVTIGAARVDFQALRATPADYQGWFLSSSDTFNRMWYSGAYTVQLNMSPNGLNGLSTRIFDGAKRDRSVWTGDLLVQGPAVIESLGTTGAAYLRASLDLLLATQRADGAIAGSPDFRSQQPLGGNPLFYSNNYSGYGVRAFIDYYRYTADTAYLTAALPALRRELAYNATFLNADGLVVSNDRDYWQTTQTGAVTKYSVDYYVLLREMAWLESKIGSAVSAADYKAKADALKTAINSRLWSDTLGAYMQSDQNPTVLVEDANALALQYGITPPERVSRVLAALRTLWTPHGAQIGTGLVDPYGHTIEPFGNGMETAGRFAAGDTAGALDLMHRTWGQMVDKRNPLYTGAFWEFLTADGTVTLARDSLAHGWAASPTVQLTEQVLGVTPVDPGYAAWQVMPHPGDLAWAKGTVPTAYGPLTVSWSADAPLGRFTLRATTPRATIGTIAVPANGHATVTVDGTTAWSNGRGLRYGAHLSGGYVHLTVPGGNHLVAVARH